MQEPLTRRYATHTIRRNHSDPDIRDWLVLVAEALSWPPAVTAKHCSTAQHKASDWASHSEPCVSGTRSTLLLSWGKHVREPHVSNGLGVYAVAYDEDHTAQEGTCKFKKGVSHSQVYIPRHFQSSHVAASVSLARSRAMRLLPGCHWRRRVELIHRYLCTCVPHRTPKFEALPDSPSMLLALCSSFLSSSPLFACYPRGGLLFVHRFLSPVVSRPSRLISYRRCDGVASPSQLAGAASRRSGSVKDT